MCYQYQLLQFVGHHQEMCIRDSGYIHYIQKGDIKNHLFYRGDVVKTVLLQLQLLKEEYDMEQRLEPMEQLSYLWMYNQPHKFSEMCDLVKGVIDVYKRQI